MAESKDSSVLNTQTSNNKKLAERRLEQYINAFPQKPPENNTVYIEVLNHYPQGGRFPRFNPKTKILFCHLHEELYIPARSWKFVNLNLSIKLPDLYVYTLSYITSFLSSKGLSVVPINLRTGDIVRLILEVHNTSKQNLKIHKDSIFFEIRFMTHYHVQIKDWESTYSDKTKVKYPIQEEDKSQEAIV